MRSIPRLREEFLKDRLRLEIRTKILRRIWNYHKIASGAEDSHRRVLFYFEHAPSGYYTNCTNSFLTFGKQPFRDYWNARKRLWNSLFRATWNARKRLWNHPLGHAIPKKYRLKSEGRTGGRNLQIRKAISRSLREKGCGQSVGESRSALGSQG